MLSTLVAFSVPLLVAANAFFVMIEFALVSVRWTRIEQLVTEGRPGARLARALVENLSDSLAATQLGITLASLALGWLGEPTIAQRAHPVLPRPAMGA
jgi:CBS domain containing-hemolysin-like protein